MLIVVEGCVGAGKSTVAKGLAAFRRSALLLEDFESNPFLRAFYDDPIGNATETEFAFLLLHFHQLKSQGRYRLNLGSCRGFSPWQRSPLRRLESQRQSSKSVVH